MAQTKLSTSPDPTPPRNRVIAMYTAVTIFSLFSLKFLFDSYFDSTFTAENERKVSEIGNDELARHREHEAAGLHDGPVPIDRAMETIKNASPTRSTIDVVRPRASTDLGARVGWAHLPAFVTTSDPHAVPPPAPEAPPAAPTPPPTNPLMIEGAPPAPGGAVPPPAVPGGPVAPVAPVAPTVDGQPQTEGPPTAAPHVAPVRPVVIRRPLAPPPPGDAPAPPPAPPPAPTE